MSQDQSSAGWSEIGEADQADTLFRIYHEKLGAAEKGLFIDHLFMLTCAQY